jgi:hypothetical protein
MSQIHMSVKYNQKSGGQYAICTHHLDEHWHACLRMYQFLQETCECTSIIRTGTNKKHYATGILLFGAAEFAVQRVEEPREELNGVALLPGPVGLLGHDRARLVCVCARVMIDINKYIVANSQ